MGKIIKTTDRNGQITYPVTIDEAVVVTDGIAKQTLKQRLQALGGAVLAVKEYPEFVAANNTNGSASIYYCFMKLVPTDFNLPLTVKYRVTTTPSESATAEYKHMVNGSFEIELTITRNTLTFNTDCKFYSTTYYPIRYCVRYYLTTSDGYKNGLGHLIGFYTYGGYLPNDATCKRDIKVEVLSISGGTFELADEIVRIGLREDYNATYHTTAANIGSVLGNYHSGDQNTTYTVNYLYDAGVQKAGIGTNAISRYVLVMQKPDLTWEKIVDTSAAYSTGTTKKVNTRGFMLGRVRYYNTTTVVANGGNAAASSFSAQASTFDMRYSTNCGTPADWVAGDPTFLVGTIGEDGLYYLDTTKWWSNALPTEEDGKIYMQIGTVVTSASYSSTLLIEHPCYRFVNGAVERYYQGLDEKAEKNEATHCTDEGEVSTPTFQESVFAAVASKVDKSSVYTRSDVDSIIATLPTVNVTSVNGQTGNVNIEVPTSVGQLLNDKGYLSEHQSLNDYVRKTDIYTKAEIDSKVADKGVTAINGQSGDVVLAIPSKVSDLENDRGYLTTHQSLAGLARLVDVYTKAEVDNLVASGGGGGGGVVSGVISVNGQTGTVTLSIPTKVSDLTNDSNFLVASDIADKVDKVSGKGLSTNDFTTTLKNKLEGLSNYNDTEVRGLISGLQSALDALTGTADTTQVIDTMNEIISFLNTYKNTDNLASVLQTLESTIHTWVESKGYIYSNNHISVVETQVTDSGTGRTGKFETLQVKTSNGKKMVYGMCTDQTSDGTGFIGGLFAENATSFPYAGGLAIGGTSKNLLYLGKPCLAANTLTATEGKAVTGFSTTNGITTFTTGDFLTSKSIEGYATESYVNGLVGNIESLLEALL